MPKRKKIESVSQEASHLFVKKELAHESGDLPEEQEDNFSRETDTAPKKKNKKGREKKQSALKEVSDHLYQSRPKRDIDRQLAEIYGNSDGSIPDMKHFEVKKRRRFVTALLVFLLSIACLGGVVWFGLFIWDGGSAFVEEDVILSVSGVEKAAVGEKVQFRIRYKNAGTAPLAKAVIEAHYPEGFVFEQASVTPTDEAHSQWTIGVLNKDDGGYIDVTGRMYGDIDSDHSVRVFMNYVPVNFTSEFQKVSHAAISLSESPVELSVDMPGDILQGVDVPIVIHAKKRPNAEITDGKYILELQSNGIFTKTKSDPKSDELNQWQWTVGQLDTEKTITVRGTFSVPQGVTPAFTVALLGQPTDVKEKRFVFAQKTLPLAIATADVQVQTIVNGSAGDLKVQPGEKLITRIAVRNNGKTPLKQAKIRFQLDAPSADKQSVIDWANITDSEDGDIQKGEQVNDTTRRGQIIWTSKQIPELANLEPGKEAVIDLTIPIKSGEQTDLGAYASFRGEIKADLQYDAGGTVQTVSGAPIALLFQSDVAFSTEYDGEQTKSTISWIIKNSFHELKDVQVKAEFFGEVTPDTSVFSPPAGVAVFDQKTKTLVWKIDKLPTVVDVLSYEFGMTINKTNPSQTQLTSKIQLEATDTVTGEKIIKIVDAIPLQ